MIPTLFQEKKIIHLQDVDSTNIYAKKILKNELFISDGTTIVANHQQNGKGQQGTIWESNSNENLTFSVIILPKIAVDKQFQISKIVALALVDFLAALEIKNVFIKWPNDIYVGKKKVAGVLIENSIRNTKIEYAIIGIGLNVNQTLFKNPVATSLKLIKSMHYELIDLLEFFLSWLEKKYFLLKTNQHKKIDAAYLENLLGFQYELYFSTPINKFKGKIVGVSKEGKLQIKKQNELLAFGIKEIEFHL